MIHENLKYKNPTNNIGGVLAGVLIGGLAGAVTMLLLAPQSGKDTRMQIREKGIDLRDRTTELMEDARTQLRTNADRLTVSGREKFKELKQHGQELVAEQLEHVSEAAQAGKKAVKSS
ncbi:MAG TPA: YtxH domain-containing protein [Anaerolineales bacterium]|nr:YtxH domain-containing protein [Anaerolineales bacterium]